MVRTVEVRTVCAKMVEIFRTSRVWVIICGRLRDVTNLSHRVEGLHVYVMVMRHR